MLKKIFITGLIVVGCWTGSIFCLGSGKVFAKGDSIAYKHIEDLDELAANPTNDTDFVPLFDASVNKDVKLDVDRFAFIDPLDNTTVPGTETVTMSADDPTGFGTSTNAARTTYVITDATGINADTLTLIDGVVIGQPKTVVLQADNETAGLAIAPDTATLVGGAGTSTLLEDAGDSVTYGWSGTGLGWIIISNEGGTAL